jgi:hypothetical protein
VKSHLYAIWSYLSFITSSYAQGIRKRYFKYYIGDCAKDGERNLFVGRFSVSAVPAVRPVLSRVKQTIFMGATVLEGWFKAMIAESEMNHVYVRSSFDPDNHLDIVLAKHDITWRFRQDARKMRMLAVDVVKLMEATGYPMLPTILVAPHQLFQQLKPFLTRVTPFHHSFLEEPIGSSSETRAGEKFYLDLKRGVKEGVVGVIHPWGKFASSFDMNFIKHCIVIGVPNARRSVESDEIIKHLARIFGDRVAAQLNHVTLRALERVLQTVGRTQRFETDKVIVTRISEQYGLPYYLNTFKDARHASRQLATKSTAEAVRAIRKFSRGMR